MAQYTIEMDIFRAAERVVHNKRENSVLMVFLKRGARDAGATNDTFKGRGRQNSGWELRSMVTESW
jgi:hypothetical protein